MQRVAARPGARAVHPAGALVENYLCAKNRREGFCCIASQDAALAMSSPQSDLTLPIYFRRARRQVSTERRAYESRGARLTCWTRCALS